MRIPPPALPSETYGELFHDVQRGAVFSDQKTFVDCVPKFPPAQIVQAYAEAKRVQPLDVRAFVNRHFLVPEAKKLEASVTESLGHHLTKVWELLRREPDAPPEGSSLLPLAHPYIIPGGRFREGYYWDAYFAMLGLRVEGREDLIRSMTDNVADLIFRHGVIPNGNRSYYLTRSQPPVLALMVELIAEQDGTAAYARYATALQAELDYWNDRLAATQHAVDLPDGTRLHRYYDTGDYPRLEAFAVDEAIRRESQQEPAELYRNIRTGAESGWDFSSRWFTGGATMAHIRTTEFLPVDLNCYLWQLESTLAKALAATDQAEEATRIRQNADTRADAIRRLFWSERDGFFFDYHFPGGQLSPHCTLAAVVPLFLRIATPAQADAVAGVLRTDFLQPGGLVTTLTYSGEQWDFPNGWAPLQWMAISGLAAYGHDDLAREIAHRWINLNTAVFTRTGRMMEKYNVVDLSLLAGGGEYPTQDGFAWSNGVLQQLMKMYPPQR